MTSTRVVHLESTASTNADALRLAHAGEVGPLWVTAREQTAGRGRRGRAWHSPPGNFYASLLLTEPCAPEAAPQLGFVIGVALVDAIGKLIGGDAPINLKWPNDVLSRGAKLAGILLEATRRTDGAFVCVAGIGVNCLWSPEDLPYRATDLATISGRQIGPDDLFLALDRSVTTWMAHWDRGRGFPVVRTAWLARAVGQGGAVEITLHDRKMNGVFETIDEQGRMLVMTANGPMALDAGDVRILQEKVPRSSVNLERSA